MSYARWSENSDVYVFLDCYGYLHCYGCHFKAYDTDAMLAHLRQHIQDGDKVEPETLEEIEADRDENDAWMSAYAARN